MTEFYKIVREYWGKKSDLSDEEIEGFEKLRKLIKKAREEEAKKILDEFFDLHRLYYENKTRRLNNYD